MKIFKGNRKEFGKRDSINNQRFTTTPINKEIRYCLVGLMFDDEENYFHYQTEDKTIKMGDQVIVLLNKEKNNRIGVVKEVKDYTLDNVPWPIKETKFIISKVEE